MRDPRALVDTATLAASLAASPGDPSLRVFDCTTWLDPTPAGSAEPYIAVPGRKTFEDGHVPGADFLDLQGEFSDTATHLHFMMPPVARLAAAFGRHGVGPGTRVVLYSIGTMMWATRFWWMLRSLGFDNVAVLDGGIDKWTAEGRDIETGLTGDYPHTTFSAKPRPRGAVTGAFLLGYGVFRFGVEYFREPDDFLGLLALNLSMGQWLSAPMIALGAGMLVWTWRRPQKV